MRGKRVHKYNSAPKSAVSECNFPLMGAYMGDYSEGHGVSYGTQCS